MKPCYFSLSSRVIHHLLGKCSYDLYPQLYANFEVQLNARLGRQLNAMFNGQLDNYLRYQLRARV